MAERYVGLLKAALLKCSIKYPNDWDRIMPAILRYHRARPHSSTGVSPFEVVFGQQVRINLKVPEVINLNCQREFSIESLKHLREAIADEWNSKVVIFKSAFELDTMVLLEKRPRPANGPLYDGPYRITEVMSFNTYHLSDDTDKNFSVLAHASRLKKISS
jgi:hypothetical protein